MIYIVVFGYPVCGLVAAAVEVIFTKAWATALYATGRVQLIAYQ